jgi:hypothetical protein
MGKKWAWTDVLVQGDVEVDGVRSLMPQPEPSRPRTSANRVFPYMGPEEDLAARPSTTVSSPQRVTRFTYVYSSDAALGHGLPVLGAHDGHPSHRAPAAESPTDVPPRKKAHVLEHTPQDTQTRSTRLASRLRDAAERALEGQTHLDDEEQGATEEKKRPEKPEEQLAKKIAITLDQPLKLSPTYSWKRDRTEVDRYMRLVADLATVWAVVGTVASMISLELLLRSMDPQHAVINLLKLINTICTILTVLLVYARYWLALLLRRIEAHLRYLVKLDSNIKFHDVLFRVSSGTDSHPAAECHLSYATSLGVSSAPQRGSGQLTPPLVRQSTFLLELVVCGLHIPPYITFELHTRSFENVVGYRAETVTACVHLPREQIPRKGGGPGALGFCCARDPLVADCVLAAADPASFALRQLGAFFNTLRVYLALRSLRDSILNEIPMRHTIQAYTHAKFGSAYAFKYIMQV